MIVRVLNSTPITDLLLILNPLRMKRESTVAKYECVLLPSSIAYVQFLYGQGADEQDYSFSSHLEVNQERRRLTTFRHPSCQLVKSNMQVSNMSL